MSISTLDNAFSQFIRLRDSDENGICLCISCGKPIPWKEADAGHYINRKHMALRFSETNVNAQCRSCNRFDEGNMEGYRRGLMKKYDESIIDKLYLAKNKSVKISRSELIEMGKYYKIKVKELLITKNE